MARKQIAERLVKAECRVKDAEEIVSRQIELIERLQDDGINTTQEAGLLRALQELLVVHITERDRVREQLTLESEKSH